MENTTIDTQAGWLMPAIAMHAHRVRPSATGALGSKCVLIDPTLVNGYGRIANAVFAQDVVPGLPAWSPPIT